MLDPKTSQFWRAAIQSGLLDAASLARCWEAIPTEKRDAPEHLDRRLGRQAVHLGLLTLWQAQQLLAGRVTGYRVDRYILQDLIGQGGMGRVYLAKDTRLGRQVALKILSPERMNNERAVTRFQREARVGAQLQHENLVRLYDFGEANGRHFLVMEFIEGRSLGFYIATEGRIPYPLAARFGRQVALGLEHAHRKDLIHRDVNPYNVIVTHEGVAKLADMGLAIDRGDEAQVTRDGATVGTFDYVAPEQARRSHSADIRSDIYSLGCSLYHMITGQVPFPYPSLAEKLFAHQSQDATPIETLAPDVPPALGDVIRKMMRKKPEERFQNPTEVAAALRPFADRASAEHATALAVGADAETRSIEAPNFAASKATGGREIGLANGSDASGEFSLRVDTGPEFSLAGPQKTPRSWFGGSNARSPLSDSDSSRDRVPSGSASSAWNLVATTQAGKRRWAIGGLILALAGSGVLTYSYLGGPAAPPIKKTPKGERPSNEGKAEVAARKSPINWDGASIVVVSPDGRVQPAADLLRAMESANGGRGVVVLKGGEPIEFKPDDAYDFAGRGRLHIKGDDETPTVLKVHLKDNRPFLSLGSTVDLTLEGLTIEVGREGEGQSPPPVIVAAGTVALDRCSLRTTPTAGYPGSVAIRTVGGDLSVDRCWFEGFQVAVEIQSLAGSSHALRRSMFVPGGTPSDAVKEGRPVRSGWAARVIFQGGGVRGRGRSIHLDHCTVAGEGLLKVSGFGDPSVLTAEVESCVVRGERLIEWDPSPPDANFDPKSLGWKGVGNQLDLVGDSWIAGGSKVPTIANLDEWAGRFAEDQAIRSGVQFTMEPVTSDGRLTPQAYALVRPDDSRPGADPQEVGP